MELNEFQTRCEQVLLAAVPELAGPGVLRELRNMGDPDWYVYFQLGELEVFIYEDETGWRTPAHSVTLEWQDYQGEPSERMYADLIDAVRSQLGNTGEP